MNPRILAYFVRHGQTGLNGEKKFRGALNPPLNEEGMTEADKLKNYFENVDLGDAYTSDTNRAETTAQIILSPKNIDPIVVPSLKALDVGYLSGQLKEGHQAEMKYYQDNPHENIPQGESLNGFRGRVRPAIQAIIRRGVTTGLPSLAVSHSSIIHELSNMLHGDHNHALVEPGGVVAVVHDGNTFKAMPILNKSKKSSHYSS
jgi:broad specificity phosphatase PhoE